jgi:hypothetical protein
VKIDELNEHSTDEIVLHWSYKSSYGHTFQILATSETAIARNGRIFVRQSMCGESKRPILTYLSIASFTEQGPTRQMGLMLRPQFELQELMSAEGRRK